jgi:hypothetical protein
MDGARESFFGKASQGDVVNEVFQDTHFSRVRSGESIYAKFADLSMTKQKKFREPPRQNFSTAARPPKRARMTREPWKFTRASLVVVTDFDEEATARSVEVKLGGRLKTFAGCRVG